MADTRASIWGSPGLMGEGPSQGARYSGLSFVGCFDIDLKNLLLGDYSVRNSWAPGFTARPKQVEA